ncbi:methyltransferase domain-containing protein [Planobispora takensis]|uniref:Methyltransferase type 11 domain-containing protein n=1 Tax=Planobispora takensis TaxID=1367882 RepID=A0A8J3TD47_9ACTN|nr:methyltransferase domain-containing protein [Planobispora takensis]GII05164.1 hypothetical protein Pta02_71720 [Planobispora takensis]
MAPRDAMQFINEQDEATLQRFVDRLEARGADPAFTGYREEYLAALGPETVEVVAEIGCGTGLVARALARRGNFTGHVIAVDQSPVLLRAARELAAADGVLERIDFRLGDAHALDLPEASVDAVIAHTLISHVAAPGRVLAEAGRVVRPGGTIAVFDGDYASLTFGCSDDRLGREMEAALLAVVVSQPRVMRAMPALLDALDLEVVWSRAHLRAEISTGAFFLGLAEAFAPLVAREKLLPAVRVEAWLAEQRRTAEQGTFFAACAYYSYLARRPPSGSAG